MPISQVMTSSTQPNFDQIGWKKISQPICMRNVWFFVARFFDSINMNFLLKSLESFGFGESFMVWIKIFHKNVSSSVTNNGFSTPSFNLKQDVHQGDPLSLSIFIIVLELLAISVHNNDQISGIVVDGNELKLVIFADDMTLLVRDKQSYLALFNTIRLVCKSWQNRLKFFCLAIWK